MSIGTRWSYIPGNTDNNNGYFLFNGEKRFKGGQGLRADIQIPYDQDKSSRYSVYYTVYGF